MNHALNIKIIKASTKERRSWLAQRAVLWPDVEEEKLITEQRDILMNIDHVAFLAKSERMVLGFAEASLQAFPEICRTGQNAYLQAWFVVDSFRGNGIGRQLLESVEDWAKSKGCKELVSSTTDAYPQSPAAHLKMGFKVLPDLYFLKDL